jgi:cysteinyl-tRNA synthetase
VIRLYDTATRAKVELEPREPGDVGIYVCGPTVYNLIHIGNARTFTAFDAVVRHLRARGLRVRYVRNVTDVDDRIIRRAAELGKDPRQFAELMTGEFHRDMDALGLLRPDVEPRVTEHMDDIVAMIAQLLQRGLAYALDGDVYYSARSFPAYGRLAGRNLDELMAGARVDVDARKRDPLDFALWKSAKPGEPAWSSPFGPGRPGWHIECSAMSARHLGARFDIHGGGMDLVFPHHENEIAQSQGALGEGTFARTWMHAGFLNLNEEKMSKSLGNIFTLREVLERHEAEAIRLFLLSAQYRNPLGFDVVEDDEGVPRFVNLDEAEERLDRYYDTLVRAGSPLEEAPPDERMLAAMDDDFNTPAALAVLEDGMGRANRELDKRKLDRGALAAVVGGARRLLGILARAPGERAAEVRDRLARERRLDQAAIEARVAERTAARTSRDFARSDAIRDELRALGVEVRDGAGGTTWTVLRGRARRP